MMHSSHLARNIRTSNRISSWLIAFPNSERNDSFRENLGKSKSNPQEKK